VFAAEVRVVKVFRLLEHVLAKVSRVHSGYGGRAGILEVPRLDRLSELYGMTRAFDIQ
jgi:hypothetical protein